MPKFLKPQEKEGTVPKSTTSTAPTPTEDPHAGLRQRIEFCLNASGAQVLSSATGIPIEMLQKIAEGKENPISNEVAALKRVLDRIENPTARRSDNS